MVIGLRGQQSRELSGEGLEITNTITPELYDTKSYYQLIGSITLEFKIRARFLSIHNQLMINFLMYRNIVQNVSEKNVTGPVNFVHVCFQSVPVNLLT